MNNNIKTEEELNDLLESLTASTHSPKGQFSSEESFNYIKTKLPRKSAHILFLKFISSAAAVIFVCIFGWNYFSTTKTSANITVCTQAENKLIKLSDGTTIMLNHYSSLTYPESFEDNKRVVALKGEGYFEVAKDVKHPFIVETRDINIQVLGTHFNIEAYENDLQTKTTLLEGSVAVKNKDNSQSLILKPNQCATYNREKGLLTQQTLSEISDEIAWKKGVLVFTNETMSEIARELSNTFNTEIVVESELLRNYRLTARFENDEKLTEILDLLKSVGSFSYKQKNNQIVIKD